MNDIILAVDCGTQSLRTILIDDTGRQICKVKMEYTPYFSEKPGWAEQDPEIFWSSLVEGCRRLKEEKPSEFARISCIGITTQRDTHINIDETGRCLRPAITWLDTRAAAGSYKPKGAAKLVFGALGKLETISKTQSDGQCNWIRENQPELWDETWKYCLVSGFLNYRLTGRVADSTASIVGHLPFDNKKRNWAGKGSLIDKMFPIEREKLADVVEPGEIIGRITAKASEETGLKKGIPVAACGSDKACETLGVGAVNTDTASFSFGTTATVEVSTDRYFSPVPFMPAYCAAVPGSWVPEVEIFRGFWMLSWFRDELGHQERLEAERTGVIPEAVMNRLLDNEPAGGRGLMLQPYWGASLKDHMAKGSIIGFGDVHGKGSIYRAIIEGLGYALREGLETIESRGRISCSRVAASGGASQSDRICQITADIMGKPLVRGESYETSALGAAIDAAVGMGIHRDFNAAVSEMVRYEKTFEPNPAHRKIYDDLFAVYKTIYPNLKKIYTDIRNITGYPEKIEV